MYIGSTDGRGLHQLVWEVVDNSIDEAMANQATRIDVIIHADGALEVVDDGRGIPVDRHRTGKSALEVIMTVLHAGGKFGGGGYKVSGGLHGVGVSVVNALSSDMRVEVLRDRKRYVQEFVRGAPKASVKQSGGPPRPIAASIPRGSATTARAPSSIPTRRSSTRSTSAGTRSAPACANRPTSTRVSGSACATSAPILRRTSTSRAA